MEGEASKKGKQFDFSSGLSAIRKVTVLALKLRRLEAACLRQGPLVSECLGRLVEHVNAVAVATRGVMEIDIKGFFSLHGMLFTAKDPIRLQHVVRRK